MLKRFSAAGLAFCMLLGASPKAPAGKRVLPIALIVNGTALAVNPAPINERGHLLVPVRRTLAALGFDFDREGTRIFTHVGADTVQLTSAELIGNTLYAPLRFFADALGSQAVFNRQTNSVEILSTLVGRSGNGIETQGGGVRESGTLSAVDLNSSPPTLTLTHNASVRTLQIRSDVDVIVQDVNAGTSNAGALEDVHVGDYAELRLDRGGAIKQLVDAYGSRLGRVAGSGAGAIVLDDGHVIVPNRSTTITLNGSNVSMDRIAVGDEVTVRYNIDSSEAREIVATRPSEGPAATQGAVSIAALSFSPVRPLKQGDAVRVLLRGTPGGRVAHYDIGSYVRNLGLREGAPGIYSGSYIVHGHMNFSDAPLIGRLNVNGTDAAPAESSSTLSVATEPPGVTDFAPQNGDVVNDVRPGIYATFGAGAVPVNVSSERITVNGHDVTTTAVRTERFIEYIPGVDLRPGLVRVTVQVADDAGNRTAKNWAFTLKR
ncbi:MAG: hypothetical protein ABR508_08405 [Candidatus Baltobacteraceae bacterium]